MAELRRLIFSHPYQNALLERFPGWNCVSRWNSKRQNSISGRKAASLIRCLRAMLCGFSWEVEQGDGKTGCFFPPQE